MNDTWYIAVEGGATRSRAALYDAWLHCRKEAEGKPCNPVAYGVPVCVRHLTALLQPLLQDCGERPCHVLLGAAGCAAAEMRRQLGAALLHALPLAGLHISTDLHPLLLAHAPDRPALLVVAGTGSAVLGKDAQGEFLRVGGRGMLFGDAGSAHHIAVEGLRAAALAQDGLGPATALSAALPKALGVNSWEAIVVHAGSYSKDRLADLARVVLKAAVNGDSAAQAILSKQASDLAAQVQAAQARLGGSKKHPPVYGQGALLLQDNPFRNQFLKALRENGVPRLESLRLSGPACMLSLRTLDNETPWLSILTPESIPPSAPRSTESPTEQVADAPPLDQLSTQEMVARMHQAELEAAAAVAACQPEIAALIDAMTARFDGGGRIIYTGAGTSGRLGVLDASECPPTFGVAPERVVGLIAGGETALRHSGEGAEDDESAGRADLQALQPTTHDCVIGLAASGTTPYVHAALREAKTRGTLTALVGCNPQVDRTAYAAYIDHLICLDTGAEVLAGSTRLKAGAATKLVLNMLSTCVMARHGLVFEGRMVGMRPLNRKLRHRAARMVADLGPCDMTQARELLEAAEYNIAAAVLMARKRVDAATAQARLQAAQGNLRQALED